jgi:hypothetical protein
MAGYTKDVIGSELRGSEMLVDSENMGKQRVD